jgi:hypothetical protein
MLPLSALFAGKYREVGKGPEFQQLISGRIGVYQGREPCKSMSTNFRAFAGQSSALPAVERP